MTKVQQILAAIATMLGIALSAGKYVSDRKEAIRLAAQHDAEEQRQRHRDREHIRQLERIITSEFPRWTAAIDWDDK